MPASATGISDTDTEVRVAEKVPPDSVMVNAMYFPEDIYSISSVIFSGRPTLLFTSTITGIDALLFAAAGSVDTTTIQFRLSNFEHNFLNASTPPTAALISSLVLSLSMPR